MKKIFFDITECIKVMRRTGTFSGIQRTVAMIALEFCNVQNDFETYFVIYEDGILKCYHSDMLNIKGASDPEILIDIFTPGERKMKILHRVFKKYKGKRKKLKLLKIKFDLLSLLSPKRFREKIGISTSEWWSIGKNSKFRSENFQKMDTIASENDWLILLDSSWSDDILNSFVKIKDTAGIKVITMVHDLIPLKMGFTTPHGLPLVFTNWIYKSRIYTDTYITNSESTKKDLLDIFSMKTDEDYIKVLKLAQRAISVEKDNIDKLGLNAHALKEANHHPSLTDILTLDGQVRFCQVFPYILCVGTLEIRKNIYRLARAWQILERKYSDLPHLIFVGRFGWGVDNFVSLMQATGNINGTVSILNDISDKELAVLYENSLGFVFPSMYEGWGLPVGEGLSYGKTGVVARNSSLMEVGEDLVIYCDAYSVEDIAEKLERLIFDAQSRHVLEELAKRRKLRDWKDVATDLASICK